MEPGDPVTCASYQHGPTAAQIIEVSPGSLHVAPLYRIRLETTGEVMWCRAWDLRPKKGA